MVRRYAHLASDHLAVYANKLSAIAGNGDGTHMAQGRAG
jgi:hypothetical protein